MIMLISCGSQDNPNVCMLHILSWHHLYFQGFFSWLNSQSGAENVPVCWNVKEPLSKISYHVGIDYGDGRLYKNNNRIII